MLLDQTHKGREKRLALHLLSAPHRTVLEALLAEWNFRLLSTPTATDLLLIEDGLLPPRIFGSILWLTHKEIYSPEHLPLPVAVEDLWRNLEGRFNSPPRAHIRIALTLPASVHWRYQTNETQVISLSDMGCRFLYPRDLAPEEEVVLHLAGEEMTLAGKAIYSMERSDLGDDTREIGLLFQRQDAGLRRRLRDLIVGSYLLRVRARTAEETFRQGLGLFRLSPEINERLNRYKPAPAAR